MSSFEFLGIISKRKPSFVLLLDLVNTALLKGNTHGATAELLFYHPHEKQ